MEDKNLNPELSQDTEPQVNEDDAFIIGKGINIDVEEKPKKKTNKKTTLKSIIWVIAIFVVAKVGCNASLVFYDAMLVDVTTEERMDTVSSHGYA